MADEAEQPTIDERVEQLEQAVTDLSTVAWPGQIVQYHTGAQSFPAVIVHLYSTGAAMLVVFGMGQPAVIRDSVLPGEDGERQAHRWTVN